MKSSAFCYVHSFGRFKRVPWHKNPLIHLALAIAGIVLTLYIWRTGPTAASQELLLRETQRNTENISEIRRLLDTMSNVDEKRRADLSKRYPLGYILFGIDHREVAIPYTSRLTSDFQIDWSQAEVKLGADEIIVTVPNILDPKRDIYLHGIGIGATRAIGYRMPAINQSGVDISLAVLADYGSSVVCALGFSEAPQPKQP
jgi:hypothetical protein